MVLLNNVRQNTKQAFFLLCFPITFKPSYVFEVALYLGVSFFVLNSLLSWLTIIVLFLLETCIQVIKKTQERDLPAMDA